MTNEKAIERMEELCLHEQDICDCKNAIDCADCEIRMAIDALKNAEKYRRHDLRNNQDDLPKVGEGVLTAYLMRGHKCYTLRIRY